MLSKDFKEFFVLLNAHRVEYLVIGGYAMAAHGLPRYTKDIDVWVHTNPDNAKNIMDTLAEFGFSSLKLKLDDFTKNNQVIQLGYPPNRIDLITGISGADFTAMHKRKQIVTMDGVDICFIGKDDLITLKTLSGRKQDVADVEQLNMESTREE